MNISNERNKYLKSFFFPLNIKERAMINLEFVNFFEFSGVFVDRGSIASTDIIDRKPWWVIYREI